MACELSESTITINGTDDVIGSLTGYGDIDTFQYTVVENETVTFNITLTAPTGVLPNATLKLFQFAGNELVQIGAASLQQYTNIFEHASVIGEYFFCLESVYATDYVLDADFTDYEGIAFVRVNAYNGQYGDATFADPEISDCSPDAILEILWGEMPPGLTFRSDGIIFGTPHEQDLTSLKTESPSFVWHRTEYEGETSYTKVYYFRVRARLERYPESYVDATFKICVYNNWSVDAEAFIRSAENFNQLTFECTPT